MMRNAGVLQPVKLSHDSLSLHVHKQVFRTGVCSSSVISMRGAGAFGQGWFKVMLWTTKAY